MSAPINTDERGSTLPRCTSEQEGIAHSLVGLAYFKAYKLELIQEVNHVAGCCCTLDLADYINPEELAAFLGVHTDTLKKWRSLGRGPSHLKLGRRALYPKADVLDWIERQRRNGDRAQRESVVLPVSISGQRVPGANRFGGHEGKLGARERAREAAESPVAARQDQNTGAHTV